MKFPAPKCKNTHQTRVGHAPDDRPRQPTLCEIVVKRFLVASCVFVEADSITFRVPGIFKGKIKIMLDIVQDVVYSGRISHQK